MHTNSTLVPTRYGFAFALSVAGALVACAPADHGADQTGFSEFQGRDAVPTAGDTRTAINYFGTEYTEQEQALTARLVEPQVPTF